MTYINSKLREKSAALRMQLRSELSKTNNNTFDFKEVLATRFAKDALCYLLVCDGTESEKEFESRIATLTERNKRDPFIVVIKDDGKEFLSNFLHVIDYLEPLYPCVLHVRNTNIERLEEIKDLVNEIIEGYKERQKEVTKARSLCYRSIWAYVTCAKSEEKTFKEFYNKLKNAIIKTNL